VKEKNFVVPNKLGLHARPAALFVHTAAKFQCSVKVSKVARGDRMVVNGKSVMGIMMLAVACGETLKVILEGADEERAMREFEDLFERKFDEA
jgi:phosphocarrier protein HPr